jgi:hypothetical protein
MNMAELRDSMRVNHGTSQVTEACMVFTFPGGQRTTSEELFSYTRKIKSKHAPPEFPSSASMAFTYRKLYNGKPEVLAKAKSNPKALEYTVFLADHALGYTPASVMKPYQVWKDAAVALGWRKAEKPWACERDEQGNAVGPLCQEKDQIKQVANEMAAQGHPIAIPNRQGQMVVSKGTFGKQKGSGQAPPVEGAPPKQGLVAQAPPPAGQAPVDQAM